MFFDLIFGSLFLFLYDILVYNHNTDEHLHHLETILQLLEANQLYAKHSKCIFRATQVE